MKHSLIEIKNNLKGTTVEEMKSRMESMIWNIRKQKTTNQNNKKKKESKIIRIVQAASGTTSSIPTFASLWGARRRRERARKWKSI